MNFENKLKELSAQAFYTETDKNGNAVQYQKISDAGSGIYMVTQYDDKNFDAVQKQTLIKFLEEAKTLEAIKKVRTKFRAAYKAAAAVAAPAPEAAPETTPEATPAAATPEAPEAAAPAAPAPAPAAPAATAAAATDGISALFGALISQHINSAEAQQSILNVVNQRLSEVIDHQTPRPIEIIRPEQEPQKIGRQHKQFEQVLKTLAARVHTLLVGAPATFKTSTAIKCAEALNLDFYSISCSDDMTEEKLLGYQNVNGDYIETQFYKAFKNGGVFLFDEIDNANPNILAAINQAISVNVANFGAQQVKKHDDFIVIAAANTHGSGATAAFVGRNQLDEATLDRFTVTDFELDEDFEYYLSHNKTWCKSVQQYRANAAKNGVKTFITPRATFNGEKLLAAGLDLATVENMVIFKGLSVDAINLIKG